MKEGEDAAQALAEQRRKTTARRELLHQDGFTDISPAVGELDEVAFEERLGADADEALALLAAVTGAADPALRTLARRLAGRVVLRLATGGPARARGVGRMVRAPMEAGRDLDVEASLDPLLTAQAARRSPSLEELRARSWAKPSTALCLLVDRSGSMGGERLAAAALAAAAVASRAPEDYSVLAFAADVVVVKAQDVRRRAEEVVDDLLTLRGHGPTDLALALREARTQLARSHAARRAVVLLSDCRRTTGDDPLVAARLVDQLHVVAPADDDADARRLAAAAGGRCVTIAGPSDVPAALASLVPG